MVIRKILHRALGLRPRKGIVLLLAATVLAICGATGRADQTGWHLIQTEGVVELSASQTGWTLAAVSSAIEPGKTLRTGPNGRAVLENNGDRITVAPNSVIELPRSRENAAMVEVKQPAGTLLYDMVPRGVDRFKVETPYLAAVIKGTVFTVNVTPQGAAVEVVRGVVQVANARGGFASLVYPGQTATVPARPDGAVRVVGHPPAGSAQPKAPQPPARTDSASTDTQAAAPSDKSTGAAITQPLAAHSASIGELTHGLITSVSAAPGVTLPNADQGSAKSTGSGDGAPKSSLVGNNGLHQGSGNATSDFVSSLTNGSAAAAGGSSPLGLSNVVGNATVATAGGNALANAGAIAGGSGSASGTGSVGGGGNALSSTIGNAGTGVSVGGVANTSSTSSSTSNSSIAANGNNGNGGGNSNAGGNGNGNAGGNGNGNAGGNGNGNAFGHTNGNNGNGKGH